MLSTRSLFLWVLGATVALSGCTVASIYSPLPQSGFAYPNSNVIPLRHSEGEAMRYYLAPFQIPDFTSGSLLQDAVSSALQTSGGDLIVDGDYTIKTKMIWLLYVQLYMEDVTVEGTAAKMELGKRNLSGHAQAETGKILVAQVSSGNL
jgi:hypothetical protein